MAPEEPTNPRLAGNARRVRLRWLTNGRSIAHGLGLLAIVMVATAVYWLTGSLSLGARVTTWVAFAAVVALVARQRRVKLFGPVLFYDLVRLARKRRILLDRLGYAGILFVVVWLAFATFEAVQRPSGPGAVPATALARFAETFFLTFSIVQFCVVALVTPAYAAGAIAEEKERRTLEFILATDLRNREIILSKLASRVATLLLLLLTGLPVLAAMQFLGGVDPDLVLAGFAATAFMGLGLASLSVLCSVYAKRARAAIVMTYLLMIGYLCLTSVLAGMENEYPAVFGLPLTSGVTPLTVRDIADWLSAGNLFLVLGRLGKGLVAQSSLTGVVGELLAEHVTFYSALAAICTTWAVARVRAIALRETAVKQPKRRRGLLRGRWRPGVTDRPMIWKEVYAEPGLHLNWAGRVVILLVAGLSIAPIIVTIIAYRGNANVAWAMPLSYSLAAELNPTIRIIGTLVACILLLGVSLRASGSITGERERQTFDELLTTPLTNQEILHGKWLGAVLSVRVGWIWLGTIWMIGLVSGAIHPVALVLLMTAWFVYAGAVAALGLGISIRQRNTVRANMATLGATIFLACGHWVVWVPILAYLFSPGGPELAKALENMAQFQAFGLTPPLTLGFLAWPVDSKAVLSTLDYETGWTFYAVIGLFIWAGVAVLLFRSAENRFRRLTGREVERGPILPPFAPSPNPVPPAAIP